MRTPLPALILGDPNERNYQDMLGQSIAVGDHFVHAHARSSSVYMYLYEIVEIKDTDSPNYCGFRDGRRIETWDTAFALRVVRMEKDDVRGIWEYSRVWDDGLGEYVRGTLDTSKPTTIKAVERIVKVELPT